MGIILLYLILTVVITWAVLKLFSGNKDKQVSWDRLEEFRKNANGKVFCPKCGNTDIGFSTSYGLNNATAHSNVCKKCGFTWNPSKKYQ